MRWTYGLRSPDTRPAVKDTTFMELAAFLEGGRIFRPATRAHKELDTPFIAPFVLRPNSNKCKANVVACGAWAGADIDYGWRLDELFEHFDGVARICFTTTQSVDTAQRLRILVELDREYSAEEYPVVWAGLNVLLRGHVDAKTKNVNRLLYVPAYWEGADNHFRAADGEALSVDGLMDMAPKINERPANAPAHVAGTPVAREKLVTQKMLDKFATAPEGGRFYQLMVDTAARAVALGWEVDAYEIERVALASDAVITGKDRPNALHEAKNAVAWAAAHVRPLTALEKLQRKIQMRGAYRRY